MASQVQTQVQAFVAAARAGGWRIEVKCGTTVTITKHFPAGDKAAYCDADMTAFGILALVPARGGSTWGTDGASVGGHVGLTNGYYTLNKSGTGKRFIDALRKAC